MVTTQLTETAGDDLLEDAAAMARWAARRAELAALLTSLPILSSTGAMSLFKAKEVGQISPSSRFASCWKPNVAYLDLNFCPLAAKGRT